MVNVKASRRSMKKNSIFIKQAAQQSFSSAPDLRYPSSIFRSNQSSSSRSFLFQWQAMFWKGCIRLYIVWTICIIIRKVITEKKDNVREWNNCGRLCGWWSCGAFWKYAMTEYIDHHADSGKCCNRIFTVFVSITFFIHCFLPQTKTVLPLKNLKKRWWKHFSLSA
mgnify:CR=1 FL=1